MQKQRDKEEAFCKNLIRLTVTGKPQGKARPRVTKYGTFTPQKTKDYEELIKWLYKGKKHDGYVEVSIIAYFNIPPSKSKSIKEKMRTGELKPDKKPDVDNIVKIVLDALNGIAYHDDKQVIKASIEKRYSDTPRVEIEIKEVV